MELNSWNRKDLDPISTIRKFKGILESVGIKLQIIREEKYKEFWYSNRIEVCDLTTIGTNGKGISPEYTMASALGEFFERLQSGMMLNYLFPFKRTINKLYNEEKIDRVINDFKKFFKSICNEMKYKELKNMIENNIMSGGVCICNDVTTGEKYVLPENLLSVLCGSNGIAAGNSFMEAFVQGMGEVFERYVTQYIFKEKYTNLFSEYEDTCLVNLKSYRLIQAIRSRKYHVRVIDCTLNGQLPVIGVLIFDSGINKYFFKIGSDADVDIALQRCITEIFQGISFDLNFRLRMNDVYAVNRKEEGFWFGSERILEHTKMEIDGTGKVPKGFLRDLSRKSNTIKGFGHGINSNEHAAKFMLKCCKTLTNTVAVINYTSLGVPCIRIIIPEICASLYYRGSSVKINQVLDSIRKFRNLFLQHNVFSIEALTCMDEILNYPAYTYEFSMTKLIGVITTNITDAPYLYNPYLFTAYLALYLKKYDMAMHYLEIYNKNARVSEHTANIDMMILKALEEKVSPTDIKDFIESLDKSNVYKDEVEKLLRIHKDGFLVPSCPKCDICCFAKVCCYSMWKNIDNSIKSYKKDSRSEEYYNFVMKCRDFMKLDS